MKITYTIQEELKGIFPLKDYIQAFLLNWVSA